MYYTANEKKSNEANQYTFLNNLHNYWGKRNHISRQNRQKIDGGLTIKRKALQCRAILIARLLHQLTVVCRRVFYGNKKTNHSCQVISHLKTELIVAYKKIKITF